MRRLAVILAAAILFLATTALRPSLGSASSAEPYTPQAAAGGNPGAQFFSGRPVMNGYSMEQFKDFEKNWHFVTVRYRKDTGEMRFTYANDIAWAALLAGKKEYPDGAVFAKIGRMTGEDPAFTSSMEPSGAKRYQFMVMDRKKNTSTDGWGYALFDAEGLTFEGDPLEATHACHACHQMVPERGYVFSRPMRLTPGKEPVLADAGIPAGRVAFTTRTVDSLPAAIKQRIPAAYKEVRMVYGAIEENLFRGTLDEIRPTLAKETVRTQHPALLMKKDGTLFSLVFPDQDKKDCALGNGSRGVGIAAVYTINTSAPPYTVQTLNYCERGAAAKR